MSIPPHSTPGRLRVHCFTVSWDGFGAGPSQSFERPLGVGGESLHGWLLSTQTFKQMVGEDGGTTGVHDEFAARGIRNIGAWILGRNMFGPVRGVWPGDTWKGWWGDNPPYHVPVFVLTHHARPSIVMASGTTFHFVTDGIHVALRRAREAAHGQDVRLGGGAATIRHYLKDSLIDELHFAISPHLLGSGESLFGGINALQLGYRCMEHVATTEATHVVLRKQG
jgi:dihydrofolate reductase